MSPLALFVVLEKPLAENLKSMHLLVGHLGSQGEQLERLKMGRFLAFGLKSWPSRHSVGELVSASSDDSLRNCDLTRPA